MHMTARAIMTPSIFASCFAFLMDAGNEMSDNIYDGLWTTFSYDKAK